MISVFDLGGTHLRVAASTDGSTLGEPVILDTPAAFEDGIMLLTQTIRELAPTNLTAIVGGIASPLDKHKGMMRNAPNLPGWNNQPIRERLIKEFNVPVRLENDTALVGLGEARVGAGRGTEIVAYITISTGVNGVRIVGGAIDKNARGFEIGHQIVSSEHINCPTCDTPGHLEGLVGGRALEQRYGRPPHKLKNDKAIWDAVIHNLAIGVHNTILHWSPDRVVLGGGMMRDIEIGRLKQEVAGIMRILPDLPEFCAAELGDIGGLYGALALARPVSGRGE